MDSEKDSSGAVLHPVSPVVKRNSHGYTDSSPTADEEQLLELGKRPIFKRTWGVVSAVGFSCTILGTWENSLVLASDALLNGGPAGVLWGFLFNWIGNISAFIVLAELASLAPIAGGQYHWVALLSPTFARKYLSYTVGWITVLAWQATNISNSFVTASVLQGTIALTYTSYTVHPWKTLLITWAVLSFALAINIFSSRTMARFEACILLVHVGGFLGVLVPLVYYGPHGHASLWTTLNNSGGWTSSSLSFLVGLPSFAYAILGADSIVHMSEEIKNASKVIPRVLVWNVMINCAFGFGMVVALVFCMGDMTAALNATERVGYSYLEIFQQAFRSNGGTAAVSSIIITINACATVGSVAASTRLLWAFARDKAVPASSILVKVSPRSKIPLNAALVTITISILLSLIILGSSIALNDILSLVVVGFYASYLSVTVLLLFRRFQGKIGAHSRDTGNSITGPDSLRWGSWRVPEPLGTVNNTFASLYLTWTFFWEFWPPYMQVTASNMNYSVAVFGGVVVFSGVWYVVRARKYFTGPVVEIGGQETARTAF